MPVDQPAAPRVPVIVPASSPTGSRGGAATGGVRAFPGAQGYGAGARGGRGGAVVHVTNLDDAGEGSLRHALETLSGPRVVVFDVGGTITLRSQILIEHGAVTIAGQTAPGAGVVIEGARIRVKASEVIIRGLRLRPGDGATGQPPGDRDALMIGTTDHVVRNVVVDRNSFGWAIDENVSINGRVEELSFTNNIVAEALSRSRHPKGEHSKGLLVSNWEGAADDAKRITIARNLFSGNMARNPEVRAGQDVEIVNNLIYNYGAGHVATGIGGGDDGALVTRVAVIGNFYVPGPSTVGVGNPIRLDRMAAGSTVAVIDNILTARPVDAAGDQAQTGLWLTDVKGPLHPVLYTRTAGGAAEVLDSTRVKATVLAGAGAVNRSGRDAVDRRILAEVAAGTGRIIDRTSEVGHIPGPGAAVSGPADGDRDGMPDWFEDRYGLDKRVPDDRGDADRDGFTNIEEYVNGIVTGFDLGEAKPAGTRSPVAEGPPSARSSGWERPGA